MDAHMELTGEQLERYSRQIALDSVGVAGQQKLSAASVLIVGVGGLGSPAALYLAAAGVGTLGLMDGEAVDVTNLQRQIIHHTPDVGTSKVASAACKIALLNPHVNVRAHQHPARLKDVLEIFTGYDFIIDGTDNFAAKFLINDACFFTGKPYSHAGVLRFAGLTMTIIPGRTACLRCVYGGPPPAQACPSCSHAGILGVVPGIVGTIQAAEALKYILGLEGLLTDRILSCDVLGMRFSDLNVGRNDTCALCGKNPSIKSIEDAVTVTG
ncbi:MAG: HesA/MoeB/ThiF family protein [Planctomycetaceae bacterium]|nr:HesA/MoeB/ThiF family protein [Planctomycetaceae bacterium]